MSHGRRWRATTVNRSRAPVTAASIPRSTAFLVPIGMSRAIVVDDAGETNDATQSVRDPHVGHPHRHATRLVPRSPAGRQSVAVLPAPVAAMGRRDGAVERPGPDR